MLTKIPVLAMSLSTR